MITFYYFTHRFKRSMLEIIPTEPSFDLSWEHVSPLYKEQFLANVTFSVPFYYSPFLKKACAIHTPFNQYYLLH